MSVRTVQSTLGSQRMGSPLILTVASSSTWDVGNAHGWQVKSNLERNEVPPSACLSDFLPTCLGTLKWGCSLS